MFELSKQRLGVKVWGAKLTKKFDACEGAKRRFESRIEGEARTEGNAQDKGRGLGRGLGRDFEPLPRKFFKNQTQNRSIWCLVEAKILNISQESLEHNQTSSMAWPTTFYGGAI